MDWCWDYYGEYDPSHTSDPTGPSAGTRHVYRGGGWNDFAKNMRSAYRAAGQADLTSYNLGVRLVRNGGSSRSGIVTAAEGLARSLTAIAKLAPDAVIGEGLSVHYSGDTSTPDEISAWLDVNGIKH